MIDGVWRHEQEAAPTSGGAFVRPATVFRDWIAAGGRFPPERGRYHLYVSLACPWAHRALIFRRIKGLDRHIGLSVTHWLMGEEGWTFEAADGVIPDPYGLHALYQLYARADPHYTGRVTVPVLWDTQQQTIVSNESADIIRMFGSAFNEIGALPGDYYPEPLRTEIDALNERIYATVNNGVYKAGFAKTQAAYETAIAELFDSLDWLEQRLARQPFLCGEAITEADWRLFTTLVRFDAVYHGHFKCNLRRLVDYPALWDFTRALYQVDGVAETVNFDHIKRHYYVSHPWLDPTGIVPVGPAQDFSRPASRKVPAADQSGIGRATLVGLNHMALEVGDIDAALAFYGRIFTFRLRGKGEGMAFIDLGDQFIALMQGPVRAEAGHRHFGLVVDNRAAVRALAEAAGAKLLDGPFLDFLDPWGNRVEVVQYADIQFTKAPSVLRGMQLELPKTKAALAELAAKSMAPDA